MKTLLLTILAFASILLPARSEWITLQVPITKADHEIRLLEAVPSATAGAVEYPFLTGFYTNRLTTRVLYLGGTFVPLVGWVLSPQQYVEVQVERGGSGDFLLYDVTAQEWSPPNQLGLATAQWIPVASASGTRKVFLVLPADMVDYEYSLIHPSGSYQIRVNKGSIQGEYDHEGAFYPYDYVTAWADWPTADAGQFRMLCHTLDMLAPVGATNLRSGVVTWDNNPFPPLLVPVEMILNESEIGGNFYVYPNNSAGQIGGVVSGVFGVENVTALEFDSTGVGAPEARRAKLSFQIPVGVSFTIERQNIQTEVVTPSEASWVVWEATTINGESLFAGDPGDGLTHNWQNQTFQLGVTNYDNWLTLFWKDANGVPLTEIALTVPAGSSYGSVTWTDEWGNQYGHNYWIISAMIDSARSWAFFTPGYSWGTRSNPGGADFTSYYGAYDQGQGPDFFDSPTYLGNAGNNGNGGGNTPQTLSLYFPPERSGALIEDSNGRAVSWSGSTSSVNNYSPWDGSYYYWNAAGGTVTYNPGEAYQSWFDRSNGDELGYVLMDGTEQPFINWFKKARLHANISSTRWANHLVVRTQNGAEFTVKKNRMVGDLSQSSAGNIYFNSYGYFDSEADYYPSLPFAIFDATRGEYLALDGEPASGGIPWVMPGSSGQLSVVTRSDETDSDGDGWLDYYERQVGTNPYLADTDGDGIPDPQDEDPLRRPGNAVGSTLLVFTPFL